jgi:hypothetical protein
MTQEPRLANLTGDDQDFVAVTNRITIALVSKSSPERIVIVRVDNWFDRKWLGFSGMYFRYASVSRKRLTVPPFNPNRILEECHYLKSNDSWELVKPEQPVHRGIPLTMPTQRYLDREFPETLLIWVSGKTMANGRGSYMAYVPTPDGWWSWYSGFKKTEGWSIGVVSGIGRVEVKAMTGGA